MRRDNTIRLVFACVLALVASVPAATDAGAATPLRIYPLGDSITVGWTSTLPAPGGYRSVLDTELTRAEVPHLMIGTSSTNPSPMLTVGGQFRHEGHNGYRIDQVTANLDGTAGAYDDHGGRWLTGTLTRPALHPDVVLVHLGSNDLIKRFDPSDTFDDGEPLDEVDERQRFIASVVQRLDALIAKLTRLRPGATVLVATIIPIADGSPAERASIEFSAATRELVAQRAALGDPVRLVDANAAFLTEGQVTPGLLGEDGVHPTVAGYAVLGRLFAAAVEQAA